MLGSIGSTIFTFGILLALLGGGAALIWWVRARFRGTENDPLGGFTLQELREIHAAGKLSETEYQTARKIILGNTEILGKPKPQADLKSGNPDHRRPSKPPEGASDKVGREG